MTIHAFAGFENSWFDRRSVSLILTWISGLLVGCAFFSMYKPYSVSMMRSVVIQPVSIVGLLSCIYLPLLFTYFSILTNKPVIILAVCFLKAVSFGFTGAFLSHLFFTADWLVRLLFMFSDGAFSVVLIWLWLRCRDESCRQFGQDFCICIVIGTVIAILDYCVISPFLGVLF